MPTFDTPEPVHVVIDVSGAVIHVRAVDGARTTTVELRPHHPRRSADAEIVAATTVELAGGRLTIRSPRSAKSRLRNLFGGVDRIDVDLTVPAASGLEMHGWGEVTAEGELGRVDIDSGMGDIRLDRTGDVRVQTAMGDIQVGTARGTAELRTSAGSVRVANAVAELVARTSAGDVRIGEGAAELRLSTSAGDVRVDRAGAGVEAKTSAGDVRLHSVRRGTVSASTQYGQLEIGVEHGTAAWLDVQARFGSVRTELEAADGPGDSELTVEIHAVSGYGDIVLRRAG